ncbi:hypothetical protein ACF0H5_017654 [Mactra antiquata]
MSDATIRHVNNLGLKYEVLSEIKHWKQSCSECISEIKGNINSLRASRATIKREINLARAQLEDALRKLEIKCEKELLDLTNKEEKTMTGFVEKLDYNCKRLNGLETTLNANLVGTKLKKSISNGKAHSMAARETLMKIKKYEIPSRIEFNITKALRPLLETETTLGSLVFITPTGCEKETFDNNVTIPEQEKVGEGEPKGINTTKETAISNVKLSQHLAVNGISTKRVSPSIEDTIVNDFEFILRMGSKYEHSLKPFIDSVKTISCNQTVDKITKKENEVPKRDFNREIVCQQSLKGIPRPRSDNTEKDHNTRVVLRPSKSAREYNNSHDQTYNTCLNDFNNEPFEEQGPISDRPYRRGRNNLNVRYNDYDFIKEMTAITDEDEMPIFEEYEPQAANRNVAQTPRPNVGANITSITYKPSSLLSSGPVNITTSTRNSAKSYFRYIARFHTKKHDQETDLCRLASLVALDNGQIVVTDINHLQMMLFAPDFTYLDHLECPSPSGLSVVSQNMVVVALFHNRKIMHVKVNMLHLERHREIHIHCPEPLVAVTYSSHQHFVLCFAGHVHIIDYDGKQIGNVETGIHDGEARFMDVDSDAERILTCGKDRVICFSITGEKLWQYTSRDIHKRFTPGDIVIYHERIFVVDWSSNKIIELSTEGTYVRDVITDNIESPHAITVQHNKGRLLVSQSNYFKQEARSRTIKVFEIK